VGFDPALEDPVADAVADAGIADAARTATMAARAVSSQRQEGWWR
jgi:hypothetical protein